MNAPASLPRFIKVDEASDTMRIPRDMIYQAINAGQIQVKRNGRVIYMLEKSLIAWAEDLPQPTSEPTTNVRPIRRSGERRV